MKSSALGKSTSRAEVMDIWMCPMSKKAKVFFLYIVISFSFSVPASPMDNEELKKYFADCLMFFDKVNEEIVDTIKTSKEMPLPLIEHLRLLQLDMSEFKESVRQLQKSPYVAVINLAHYYDLKLIEEDLYKIIIDLTEIKNKESLKQFSPFLEQVKSYSSSFQIHFWVLLARCRFSGKHCDLK